MKLRLLLTAVVALGSALSSSGQGAFEPLGLDHARVNPNTCNPNVGCPEMAAISSAGVQWIRIAAWWNFIEPSAPDRGQSLSGVYGRLSGLHTYSGDWGGLDYEVALANSYGIKVLLTISYAPPWATGSPYSDCPPPGGSCHGGAYSGYAPLVANDLRDLSFNLTQHFGSQIGAVQAWNEPNSQYEFNVGNMSGTNYWTAFVNQILTPIHDGVKTANSSMLVIAPSIARPDSVCTTPSSGCGWWDSWFYPESLVPSLYDVLAYNRYPNSHNDLKNELDAYICPFNKPVWVTELGYNYTALGAYGQASNIYWSYVDLLNRSTCWTKMFYHDLDQLGSTGGGSELGLREADALTPRLSYSYYKDIAGLPNTPSGMIAASPNPCTVAPGGYSVPTCSVTIGWSALSTTSVEIWVSINGVEVGELASSGVGGPYTATAPWITAAPDSYLFSLYDYSSGSRGALLNSLIVTGH